MPRAQAYIGTSGWQYDHWRDAFYAEGLPKRRWLEHFGRRFPTVEVNGSFYSLPRPKSIEAWLDATPSSFRFTMKMWRGVTHYKKLKDARPHMKRFFDAVAPLEGRRRGPVLVQLPPQLKADPARLAVFLDDLRDVTRPALWKVAVEFRHPSWLDREVYHVLEAHGAVAVVHDMGPARTDDPGEGSFVYMRRHGPGGDVSKGYSDRDLAKDARQVRAWQASGRTVYVYYNNDVDVHAPRDAQALMQQVA